MSWRDNIREGRALRAVYGLHIAGCPKLFVSEVPLDQDGNEWSAPKPGGISPNLYFDVVEGLLVRSGIKQLSTDWDPKNGVASGGSASFSIAADEDIRELFAADDPTIVETLLAYDVGYDDADTDYDRYRIRVDDASAFDDPAVTGEWGFINIGTECSAYNSRTSSQFGDNTSGDIIRGMWNWREDSRLSRDHLTNEDNYRSRMPVTDRPTNWYGRRVTLFAWLADEQGYCLDDAYRGDNEVEIWSGFLKDVQPSKSNWEEYTISCSDLTDALRQNVGVTAVSGLAGVGVPFSRIVNAGAHGNNVITLVGVYDTTSTPGTWVERRQYVPILEEGVGDRVNGYYPVDDWLRHYARTLEATVNDIFSDNGDTATVSVSAHLAYWDDPTTGAPAGGVRVAMSNSTWDYPFEVGSYVSFTGAMGAFGREMTVFQFSSNDTTYVDECFHEMDDTVIDSGDTDILVYPDPSSSEDWEEPEDEPGWAVLTDAETPGEVLRYEGVEAAPRIHPNAITLTGCTRGLLGTTAQSFSLVVEGEDGEEDTTTAPTVKFIQGFEDTSILTIAAQIMLSTGTEGAYHSTLDVLGKQWAMALDPACVDTDIFADSELHPPFSTRNLALAESTTLEELVRKQGVFSGFSILPKTLDDGTFRLTVVNLDVPQGFIPPRETLEMGNDGGILHDPLPSIQLNTSEVVTSISLKTRYNPTTQEYEGTPFILENANMRLAYGKSTSLDVETPGVPVGDLTASAVAAAERLFFLYGRPWSDVSFSTDARGLLVAPGDIVEITIPNIPTPYSATRGLTSVLARVIASDGSWFQPGDSGAVKVTVRLFPQFSGFAPTFTVVDGSYDAGPPVLITVEDNDWTNVMDKTPTGDSPAKDYHHGPPAGETWDVYIFNDGDVENREAHTITPTSNPGEYQLDSALTLTPGAATQVEFRQWDDCDPDQLVYVFIADDDATLGSGDDAPQKWSP